MLFCGMLVLRHGMLAFVAILMPLSLPVVIEEREDDDDGREEGVEDDSRNRFFIRK
jgi:hypothetical protein